MSIDEIKDRFNELFSKDDFVKKYVNKPNEAKNINKEIEDILLNHKDSSKLADFFLEKIGVILVKNSSENPRSYSEIVEVLTLALSKNADKINKVLKKFTEKEFFERNKLSKKEIKKWYILLAEMIKRMVLWFAGKDSHKLWGKSELYKFRRIFAALEKGGLANYLINSLKEKDINKKTFALKSIINITSFMQHYLTQYFGMKLDFDFLYNLLK